MCRDIRALHSFAPPATDDEVRAAALQYVREISRSTRPSRADADAFEARRGGRGRGVAGPCSASWSPRRRRRLREVEAAKARAARRRAA